MKKLILGLGFVLGLTSLATAQKIVLIEGDLSFMKDVKELKLVYDFSNFAVGDFATEKEYKDKKIKEMNAKEAGRGDKWSEAWESDKRSEFPQKFEQLFQKGISISAERNNDANYMLTVKTKFIEPGFNVGVARKSAAVSFEYIFTEKGNDSKVLARLSQNMVPGKNVSGGDYDAGIRISESYAKAGKMLAAFVAKKLK